jgi:hypothetical protein
MVGIVLTVTEWSSGRPNIVLKSGAAAVPLTATFLVLAPELV